MITHLRNAFVKKIKRKTFVLNKTTTDKESSAYHRKEDGRSKFCGEEDDHSDDHLPMYQDPNNPATPLITNCNVLTGKGLERTLGIGSERTPKQKGVKHLLVF